MECLECFVGGIHCNTGPCICVTEGKGFLGCGLCCLICPFNCLIGSVWGVVDYLTCHCCGVCK